ncbi:uncharacterized protein LOC109614278 isoform X2 [Musca domestica]|uniref:Uncharacterized protein LOC109614278 isoform X2 n=1 Tax=Musca domestica TaxID=7370 RepID=A0A9J7IGD4_MUSDO|nr:uncharacterized protein LOC109614278 isoform X2 [Musca domestica]
MILSTFFRIVIFLVFCIKLQSATTLVLRNLRCKAIDPDFVKFDICEATLDRRRRTSISITARLLQLPVRNCYVSVTFGLTAGTNVPLFNGSWDGCAFLRNPRKYLAFNRMYNFLAPFTNINHTCPYNHDIILRNFTLWKVKPIMALPEASYKFSSRYLVGSKHRASVDVQIDLVND